MNALFQLQRIAVAALAVLSAACVTQPTKVEPVVVYVESPRLCQGAVRTYSDFATIESGPETVIGHCNEPDGVPRNAPAVWVKAPDGGAWQPPDRRVRALTVEQGFARGHSDLRQKPAGLEKALALLKASPDNRVLLVGHHSTREDPAMAAKRIAAARRWLLDRGINAGAISTGSSGQRGELVELQLSVLDN